MSLEKERIKWPVLPGIAVAAGVAIAAVDNFAQKGEVSPIVIVGLLLAATAAIGTISGMRGSPAALFVWVWVPLAHVLKKLLDLPDTLHPNTYLSILMLAAFTLAVTAMGTACGIVARRLAAGFTGDGSASA